MLILASLETETTKETNDDAEEPVEADSLKELQSHTQRDIKGHNVFQICKNKKQ